jgi:glycosyltransferase involved in cell wall biosynthesis
MSDPSATASSPRVTVIIPTYNWSSVLPYSIGSVLRQSFTDFEVLVVGDGCSDDSEQVVTAMADPRVRWINLPVNAGHQSAPNNEGIRQARGPIIAYLGHDDLWLPHHLEVMVAAIDAGADVAHSIVHMIDGHGNVMLPARGLLRFEPGLSLPPTGVVHRRIATERIGGWRDYRTLSVDPETDLLRRMHEAGLVFQFVPRLTAVKFPASRRKDVYKKRSCLEQQQWTERICKEPALEAMELARLLVAAADTQPSPTLMSIAFRGLLGNAGSGSPRWRLLFSIRRLLSLGRLQSPENGAEIRRLRRFKGVPNAN